MGLVQSPAIQVTVNGESKTVPPDQSVAALLKFLTIDSDHVAVELNKSLVRKRDWQQTAVSNGSQIEIVEFVGGG